MVEGLSLQEKGFVIYVRFLDEAVSISLHANALWERYECISAFPPVIVEK